MVRPLRADGSAGSGLAWGGDGLGGPLFELASAHVQHAFGHHEEVVCNDGDTGLPLSSQILWLMRKLRSGDSGGLDLDLRSLGKRTFKSRG